MAVSESLSRRELGIEDIRLTEAREGFGYNVSGELEIAPGRSVGFCMSVCAHEDPEKLRGFVKAVGDYWKGEGVGGRTVTETTS